MSEKQAPHWLKKVWKTAQAKLSDSEVWVVCGYSLPNYDMALKKLFQGGNDKVRLVFILDPFSKELAKRWQTIAPRSKVFTLRGLPEGSRELQAELENLFG